MHGRYERHLFQKHGASMRKNLRGTMTLAFASSQPKALGPAHFRTWHSRVCCTLHPVATCLELICGANKLRAVHTHAGEASMDAGTARHQHGRHSCGVVCMRTTPSVAVHASLEHMQVCDTARAHRSHPSTFHTKPERVEPAQWLTGMQGGLNAWMTQQKNSAEHRNRL